MFEKMTNEEAQAFADGHYQEREELSADAARLEALRCFEMMEYFANRAYIFTYLEAKLRCDEYFDGKNHASDVGATYGYILAFVRQDHGTTSMRFALKKPTANGNFRLKNLKSGKKGYTLSAFREAAHDFERNLALHLEEHYVRLRDQGKKTKKMLRMLRTIEIFKDAESLKNE